MSQSLARAHDIANDIEDFTRFEFKYVLDNARAAHIEDEIGHFMTYDGHIDEELGKRYHVRSLYFDDTARSNFYEKIDGLKSRRKYRLRTYGTRPGAGTPIFLEEKNRIDNRVFKHRTPVTPDQLPCFEELSPGVTSLIEETSNPVIERFVSRGLLRRERPVVLVNYLRRAFVSDYDINFRVTFDSSLHGAQSRTLFPRHRAQERLCLPGYTILEVKFARRIPSWFHRIVQGHQLRRRSVSKYCTAMEACGLATDLS